MNGPLPLTPQQARLWRFIASRESAPSFVEMRDAMGLKSKSGVHRMVAALEERGFIRRMPNKARAIEVVEGARLPVAPFGMDEIPTSELRAELQRREAIQELCG